MSNIHQNCSMCVFESNKQNNVWILKKMFHRNEIEISKIQIHFNLVKIQQIKSIKK